MDGRGSRRDFIRGRVFAERAEVREGLVQRGAAADRVGAEQTECYFLNVTRRAMACLFEVRLNAGQYADGTEAALRALELLDELEEQMSIFRPSSEISRINREAAFRPVVVEPGLFSLLELAQKVHRETGGAYDLTSTPLWKVWGFAKRAGAVPEEAQLAQAREYVGGELVELDPIAKSIRFLKPGMELNLGSIGKGYAIDRCTETLQEAQVNDLLFHGGQSSVLARGSQGGLLGGSGEGSVAGWVVGVRHPFRPDRRLAEIRLRNRALSTSGSWAQSFQHQGRRFAHIIDPRSGWPAEGVLSATVVAPTATLAEALSTAFFVLGPEDSLQFCQKRPEIGAFLVCPVRHSGGIELHTAGLAEADLAVLC